MAKLAMPWPCLNFCRIVFPFSPAAHTHTQFSRSACRRPDGHFMQPHHPNPPPPPLPHPPHPTQSCKWDGTRCVLSVSALSHNKLAKICHTCVPRKKYSLFKSNTHVLPSMSHKKFHSFKFIIFISADRADGPDPTLLEKFWRISLYIFEWWRYCKALCDVKLRQIEGNGKKFRHIELSNSVIS